MPPPDNRQTTLAELALLFARLGATVFGGPAAHIAVMHDEVVRRRAWLSEERFLDLLAAANLMPGPNSTELAIHIGYVRRGWLGLLVAGACFILPAALLSACLGWVYLKYGALPQVQGLLDGVKPVILAVVLQAVWQLGQKALRDWALRVLAILAATAAMFGAHELALLLGGGLALVAWRSIARDSGRRLRLPVAWMLFAGSSTPAAAVSLLGLFGVFLKAGALLFGSGYVLLAFLQADLVERLQWLTQEQLIDAIAVGQITPGPVFSTATFIGYLLAGPSGAAAATLGIFLPAFVFVAMGGWLLPRLRASATAADFLDGVIAASLALMCVVLYQLGRSTLTSPLTWLLASMAALLLLRWRINSAWLIAGGALVGMLLQYAAG